MKKIVFKSIYRLFILLILMLSLAGISSAADNEDAHNIVELNNGDQLTGTILNDTFTVTTPYSIVNLEKDKISEIIINPENNDNDVIILIEGGSVEGTLDEPSFTFKSADGKTTSLKKEKCKKIILKNKKG